MCVGDWVSPPTGTHIRFGNLSPILGFRTPNDNLVVVCVVVVYVAGVAGVVVLLPLKSRSPVIVVCVASVAVVVVLSPLKLRNAVIVVVAVVLVAAAAVAGRIGPGGQWRDG